MQAQADRFIVVQWPRNLPTGPMQRYAYEFASREEAEEFRQVVEVRHPDLEFEVQKLN